MKWYDKPWIMWLLLLICWPIGFFLLYRKRTQYKNWKIIAIVFLVIWLVISISSNKKNASLTAKPTTQTEEKAPEKTEKSITSGIYFLLSEKAIAKQLNVQVVSMDLMNYWEMEHKDTGLADTKGTFELDGKKHTFSCRFGIESQQLVKLHIDDQSVFFDEDTQDMIMDEQKQKK